LSSLALPRPGRIEFLRYQLKNRFLGSQRGAILRAINYFNAFGAFVTGDQKFDVDTWRVKLGEGNSS
jgi:hypothetical protein